LEIIRNRTIQLLQQQKTKTKIFILKKMLFDNNETFSSLLTSTKNTSTSFINSNISNCPDPKHVRADYLYTQTREINIYVTTFITIIGLIGNGLAVFVFAHERFRVHSSSVYLLFLAISDGLFLVTHFFEVFIILTLRRPASFIPGL
jgi:hypothetical protein